MGQYRIVSRKREDGRDLIDHAVDGIFGGRTRKSKWTVEVHNTRTGRSGWGTGETFDEALENAKRNSD